MRTTFMLFSAFLSEQLNALWPLNIVEVLHLSPDGFLGRAELIKIWAAEERGNWSVCCFFLFQKRQDNYDDDEGSFRCKVLFRVSEALIMSMLMTRLWLLARQNFAKMWQWWKNSPVPWSFSSPSTMWWWFDDELMITTMVMTQWCRGCLLPSWHIPPRGFPELRGHPHWETFLEGGYSEFVSICLCVCGSVAVCICVCICVSVYLYVCLKVYSVRAYTGTHPLRDVPGKWIFKVCVFVCVWTFFVIVCICVYLCVCMYGVMELGEHPQWKTFPRT